MAAASDPRTRITDAALAQFSARGVDATSIQRVADAVDMSKQALMHHFPTKAALREAVFDSLAERMQELFPEMLEELGRGEPAGYRDVVEAVGERFEKNAEIARFVLRELLDRPDETMAWLRDQGAPLLSLVQQLASTGEFERELEESFDPEAHISVVAGLLLFTAAVAPSGAKDKRWRRRLHSSALGVIRRGSGL
jgi:AcrR family transcriptional regulator